MDVLIADFDFFSTAGGGQTYYRKLVERNPGVRFHFFTRNSNLEQSEPNQDLVLPTNAFPIPYKCDKRLPYLLNVMPEQFPCITPEIIYGIADEAANMAYSVAGRTFDVVDVPSFRSVLLFLTAMFQYNEVRCSTYVLSIHGWAHKAIDFSWERERSQAIVKSLLAMEQGCLEGADIRYEISKFSFQNTEQLTSYPLLYYDIHNVLDSICTPKTLEQSADNLPDIWYPARLDRQKGADIFLQIVSRLPKNLYGSIRLCGPDGEEAGRTWSDRVLSLAQSLGVEIFYHGSLSRDQVIEQVFSQPNYCIFPSRYDSFGLAITEALFSGCPVAASDQCGASHFLLEEYPEIPFTLFDINNLDTAVQKISEDLAQYAQLRDNLRLTLLKSPLKSWSQDAVIPIYHSQAIQNPAQRALMEKYVFSAILAAKAMEKSVFSTKIAAKFIKNPYILRLWRLVKSICPMYLRKILRKMASLIK
ncbi:glycosyltransferase family 4 protein [Nostoc sphaeroides CHAB 2801]|uniref:glycosyltransferase family 4 protein n=1 Tax=Nostoc sphaeroides TaxID=446679 RepID=UPI0015F346E0|nr:glycosyltransferase family 4 protein [Nostoc sphaeroides]MCC5629689.1 glycosyltransferase family 4 protein [Nostoc sphaeroides CHAB 2801]